MHVEGGGQNRAVEWSGSLGSADPKGRLSLTTSCRSTSENICYSWLFQGGRKHKRLPELRRFETGSPLSFSKILIAPGCHGHHSCSAGASHWLLAQFSFLSQALSIGKLMHILKKKNPKLMLKGTTFPIFWTFSIVGTFGCVLLWP